MASVVRATAVVTVREVLPVREGKLDNGQPWVVHEVECLDDDFNKCVFRIDPARDVLEVGKMYTVEFVLEYGRGIREAKPFVRRFAQVGDIPARKTA